MARSEEVVDGLGDGVLTAGGLTLTSPEEGVRSRLGVEEISDDNLGLIVRVEEHRT